jgi:hypothetical protein
VAKAVKEAVAGDAPPAQPTAIEEANQQHGNVIEPEVTNDSAASESVGDDEPPM